jgi:acetoacetyl-CoA synthetase
MTSPTVIWQPPSTGTPSLSRFIEHLGTLGLEFADYEDVRAWSVEHLDVFWLEAWRFFELPATAPPERSLSDERMPGWKWFPGVATNYAEAVLRMPGRSEDDVVVVARSQSRQDVRITKAGLRARVAAVRSGLLNRGIRCGDRVAAYAPNTWETLVLMLATASIGAIFSSCAPEFGTAGVIDRLSQLRPRLLLAVDGYVYGAKRVSRCEQVAEIRRALPGLEVVVWLPYLDPDTEPPDWAITYDELAEATGELEFELVDFDHPLYILFSSGTTGLPKPIVHGHGGIMLAHCAAQGLQYDMGPADTFYWFTTTGWMMWNYLVSALMLGATIVLFDGDPAYPGLDLTWSMADEFGITQLGTSAPYIMECRKAGLAPGKAHDLSKLRGVGSTGSPLPAAGFDWIHDSVSSTAMPSSQSGGTDVCSGFVGGSPLTPVYSGEISCRLLGVAVEAFDESGRPVRGRPGELVITRPMPSMPVGFWGDEDGSRYRAAYFETYPGAWHHGDRLMITERGTCIISGRSDATLNRGGVRLGTSEFYSIVEDHPSVADSLVVHVDDAEGGLGVLWLLVVLTRGARLTADLRQEIAVALRGKLSPRHVPDRVVAIDRVPRTISGKKLEIPVKRVLTGTPLAEAVSIDAVADPRAFEAILALVQAGSPE